MPPLKKPAQVRPRTLHREWRKYFGISQEEAAARVEIDRTTLSKIERGQLPYNQDFLERLALAYGCEASDFLETNPLVPKDPPRLVWDALKKAAPEKQAEALRIVEALLKAG